MGFELQKKFHKSNVFKAYYKEAMDGENIYTGKIWPIPVVRDTCNELLQEFLKSKEESFKDFFIKSTDEKFKKKKSRARLINYILTLFFSIENLSNDCYEIDIFRSFFNNKWKKSVFKNWRKARKAIFRAKGINYSSKEDISQLFLTKSEVLILAQRTCNESVEVFERWLEEEAAKLKELRVKVKRGDEESQKQLEKDQRFYKIDRTSSAVVLWKIMRYYFKIEANEKELERRKQLTKKIGNIMFQADNTVIEVDDDGRVINNDRISRASSINGEAEEKEEEINNLKAEKRAIGNEIKRLYREANLKYQACVLMAGFARAMEGVSKESKERMNEAAERLKVYIDDIEDEELQRKMFIKMGGYYGKEYFDKGSKIVDKGFDKMMRAVRKNPDTVKFHVDLEHRSRSYRTHCNQYLSIINYLVYKNADRFKVQKLSKKETEEKKIAFVNKDLNENISLKNRQIQKDKPKNDIIDRSVIMEDEVHDIIEEPMMHSLVFKLQEKAKTDRRYLEDPVFTGENNIKTKQKTRGVFNRQQTMNSEISDCPVSERDEKKGDDSEKENDGDDEGKIKKLGSMGEIGEDSLEEVIELDDAEIEDALKGQEEPKESEVNEENQKESEIKENTGEKKENEEPKPEEPKLEEPKLEEPKPEEPKPEEKKPEEPKPEKKKGFFGKLKDMAKEKINNILD